MALVPVVAPVVGTRVISLVPTPSSVPADVTAVTLVATVKDSDGKVPGRLHESHTALPYFMDRFGDYCGLSSIGIGIGSGSISSQESSPQ